MTNKSEFLKARHSRAREQKAFYDSNFKENIPYSEFLKNETPLQSRLVVYEVSYQLNYSSQENGMKIQSPETFKVFTLQTGESADRIVQGTIEAVQNSKVNGNGFATGTQQMIEENIKVDISKMPTPRGMEQVKSQELNSDILQKINQGKGFYVQPIDQNINVENKKGSKAKMKANLDFYI